jgi:hypothetical protein
MKLPILYWFSDENCQFFEVFETTRSGILKLFQKPELAGSLILKYFLKTEQAVIKRIKYHPMLVYASP